MEAVDGQSEGDSSASGCGDDVDEVHPKENMLALCQEADVEEPCEEAEVEEAGEEKETVETGCCKGVPEGKLARGISRCRYTHTNKLYYEAMVGFEGIVASGLLLRNLSSVTITRRPCYLFTIYPYYGNFI